jgi:exodeoxyribonuclease VII small subunit
MKPTDKQPGFEKSLERLETIVQEMESGTLSLDKMMKDFEEGMGLVKLCNEKLNEVEHKIEILVQKNGQTTAEPFAAPEGGAEPDKETDKE